MKVNGTWTVTAGGGSLSVTKGATVQVRYGYTVTFTETGLAPGTGWTVSSQGQSATSNSTSIELNLTNGTDGYTVHAVSGYKITNTLPPKKVPVDGAPTTVTVTFAAKK